MSSSVLRIATIRVGSTDFPEAREMPNFCPIYVLRES